jgi:hypothetical protein
MTTNGDDNEPLIERRKANGVGMWVHWVGDAVSLVIVLLGLAYSNGKLDERVTTIERKQAEQAQQSSTDRRELKSDMQREFGDIRDSLRVISTTLTQLMMERKK